MVTLGFAFELLTNFGSMPKNVFQKGRVGMFESMCVCVCFEMVAQQNDGHFRFRV